MPFKGHWYWIDDTNFASKSPLFAKNIVLAGTSVVSGQARAVMFS